MIFMDNCQPLLASIQRQLSSAFRVESVGSICVVSTPFTYPDNRSLQIFVSSASDGSYELSDDGYAHSYVRLAGVSKEVITSVGAELSERLGLDTSAGEVVSRVGSTSDLLSGMIALVEGSQRIADSIARKRLGETTARLDRQIATTLVAHDRVYRKKDTVPVGDTSVDVDYNVLPTDGYQQLSLFSVNNKISQRYAESIAYRANLIRDHDPVPGYTNRIVALLDDSIAFSDTDRWRRIRETISRSNISLVPITDTRRISELLTA